MTRNESPTCSHLKLQRPKKIPAPGVTRDVLPLVSGCVRTIKQYLVKAECPIQPNCFLHFQRLLSSEAGLMSRFHILAPSATVSDCRTSKDLNLWGLQRPVAPAGIRRYGHDQSTKFSIPTQVRSHGPNLTQPAIHPQDFLFITCSFLPHGAVSSKTLFQDSVPSGSCFSLIIAEAHVPQKPHESGVLGKDDSHCIRIPR